MEKIKINKMISIFSIQDHDLFTTLFGAFNYVIEQTLNFIGCLESKQHLPLSRQFYLIIQDVPNQNNAWCSNFWAMLLSRLFAKPAAEQLTALAACSPSFLSTLSPCDNYRPVTIFEPCPEVVIISDILCINLVKLQLQ